MTYEEFQAELEKTPELLTEIADRHTDDFKRHLTEKKGLIVTDTEGYAKDRQRAIDEGSRKAHEAWEGKIKALTGIEKNAGEKGLDYYDRVSTRIKYLKEDTDDTPEGRAELSALKQLQNELKSLKEQLSQKETESFNARVSAEISAGVRALKFFVPAHIKEDGSKAAYQRDQVAANVALFERNYTPEARADGGIQYKDKDGNVLVDANGLPLSVDAIFTKNHAHLLAPTGHRQGGAGSVEEGNTGATPSGDFKGKTTEEIRATLAKEGLAVGTSRWSDAYKKAHEAAGLKW